MDIIKKAWQYFKPYKKIIFMGYFMSIVIIVLNMVNPRITGIIFDEIFSEDSNATLGYVLLLLGIMIGSTILRHVVNYSKSRIIEKASMKANNKLKWDALNKYFNMSFETFNKVKTGNILTILNTDTENIKAIFSNTLPILFEAIFSFAVASVILFSLNWKLALLCYLVLPLIYLSVRQYSKDVRPVYVEIREQTAKLSGVAQENINGIRQVKAFAREDFECNKMDKVNKALKDARFSYVPIWCRNYWKMHMLSNLAYILTIGVGGILICYGEMTMGEMIAFTGYISYLMNPINLVSTYITQLQTALVSGAKLFEHLEKKPLIEEPKNPKLPDNWDIEFENVCLSYNGNIALDNINITIPFGTKVGIVGATSSGKSSFINMIPRFFDPLSGKIKIGGTDIKECSIEDIRKNISMVMQDVFLFSDSIAENIGFSGEYTQEEIENSAKAACAHDFILKTEDGYETIVGERGVGLSGGQKQRISMARAFIKPSKILILDDCTSALDNNTEKTVLKNIDNLSGEKTVIIIASRFSSVKDADIILYFDHGRIAESGTHEELMKLNGMYAKVFNEQYNKQ